MTREEAINLLKQVNHILVNDDDYWTENTHEPLNTAFSMAIKALEQEPILDKIRAEIEAKIAEPQYQHEEEDWQVGLIMAETIIDKYRAESEE